MSWIYECAKALKSCFVCKSCKWYEKVIILCVWCGECYAPATYEKAWRQAQSVIHTSWSRGQLNPIFSWRQWVKNLKKKLLSFSNCLTPFLSYSFIHLLVHSLLSFYLPFILSFSASLIHSFILPPFLLFPHSLFHAFAFSLFSFLAGIIGIICFPLLMYKVPIKI